jgi:uncharacterized protein (TIGR03083 family)
VPTTLPKEPVVAALGEVWGRLDELLAGLDDAEWLAPTCLPGWDVKAVVAHIVGTESMLLGDPNPAVEFDPSARAHIRNEIGRLNEAWIVALADDAPADVLARFRDRIKRRRDALSAMPISRWDAVGFTPAGQDTYGRFMRIRAFDCWLHEQDIRDAVGQPGGEEGVAVAQALDEMAGATGFIVGKKAAAAPGSRVRFELTGPAARTINVEVGDRAAVVDELSGPPTVTLTMPAGVFARLGGGRADPATLRGQVTVDGDAELAERIVASMAYTI